MRVLFIGGYGAHRHVGDDAILAGHLHELRRLVPSATPVVAGQEPERLAERFGCAAVPGPESGFGDVAAAGSRARAAERSASILLAARGPGAARRRVPPPTLAFLAALAEADCLIAVSAGSFTSRYSLQALWPQAVAMLAAHRLGKPVLVSGVTAGPFTGPADRLLASLALRKARLVAVRDRMDSAPLVRRLGVRRASVVEQPDPALSLPRAADGTVDAALERAGVAPGGRFAVLCLSASSLLPAPVSACAEAIDMLAERHGLTTVFMPMSLGPAEDDRRLVAQLASANGSLGDRLAVLDPLPPDPVLAGIIARAELTFGSRYHLAAFGAAAGVPGVGLHNDEFTRRRLAGLVGLGASGLTLLDLDQTPESLLPSLEQSLATGRGPKLAPAAPLAAIAWLQREAAVSSTA